MCDARCVASVSIGQVDAHLTLSNGSRCSLTLPSVSNRLSRGVSVFEFQKEFSAELPNRLAVTLP